MTAIPPELADVLEAERAPLVEARCIKCGRRLFGQAGIFATTDGLYWFSIESPTVPDPTPSQRRDRRLELGNPSDKLHRFLPFGAQWSCAHLDSTDGPDVGGWCTRHERRTFTRRQLDDAVRRGHPRVLS